MPSSKEIEEDDLRSIDTSCWLFVGRVPVAVSTSELGDYFDQVGTVEKVLIDYGMGKIYCKLIWIGMFFQGILKFKSKRSRDDAVEYLNGTFLKGSSLNLEKCTPQNVKKALKFFPERKEELPRKRERSSREESKSKKMKIKYNLPSFFKICDLTRFFAWGEYRMKVSTSEWQACAEMKWMLKNRMLLMAATSK